MLFLRQTFINLTELNLDLEFETWHSEEMGGEKEEGL